MSLKNQNKVFTLFVFIILILLQIKANDSCKDQFSYNGGCLSSCSEDLLPHYGYSGEKQICASECQENYFLQLDSKSCRQQCIDSIEDSDLYEDYVNRKCLKKIEDCKNYITNNNQCVGECKNSYPAKIGELYYCKICLGYLEKGISVNSPNQCVKQCSSSYPYITNYWKNSRCQTEQDCKGQMISSDNKQCDYNCQKYEMTEIINGEKKCVKQCSKENPILKFTNYSLSCEKNCESGLFSSDKKYCLDNCADYLEFNDNGNCMKCKQDEFFNVKNYENNLKKVTCSNISKEKVSIVQFIKDFDIYNINFQLKETQNYFIEFLTKIINLLDDNKLMHQQIKQLSQLILKQNLKLLDYFNFPLEFRTNTMKIINQLLEVQQPKSYNKSFSISKLKQNNSDNLTIPSKTQYREEEFFPTSLFVIISQKNFLCDDSKQPDQCFEDNELIQVLYDRGEYSDIGEHEDIGEYDSLEEFQNEEKIQFDILFDQIDQDDLKNIQQYQCLTTKDGIMTPSLKTEIINSPAGVKCTFKNNVTLYLDPKYRKKCSTEKPIFDPAINQCISKLDECQFIFENGQECATQCSADYSYQFKKSENQTVCQKACQDTQIIFESEGKKICLKDKRECKQFLVDNKICSSKCPSDKFQYKDVQNYCTSQCLPNHIVDNEAKKCYNDKKECTKFISSNEKECNSKCSEYSDLQYYESIDNYKQCKICKNFIKEENNIVKCVTQCNKGEMIYQTIDNKNKLRKCVTQDFCSKKIISSKDSNICSDMCNKPEINFERKCVISCPVGSLYSPQDNSCTKECGGFFTSDGTLCVVSCNQVFEVVGEQKKCKKCDINQYLSKTSDGASICQKFENTDENLEVMKVNIVKNFEKVNIQSVQESDAAQQVIISYAAQIENKLNNLSNKSEHTQQDLTIAKSAFQSVLDITQAFLTKVDPQIQEKPVKISTKEFMVTAQLAQPGKKFKTSFSSNDIESGSSSLLELDPDEASTKFVPSILQTSYLKKSHFCVDTECKEFPHLFVVTYDTSKSNRLLAEIETQQFEISYQIPQDQELQKLQCLSFNKNGQVQRSEGNIQDSQIKCKFEYSSALFYDKNCEFVKNCEDDDEKISSGAIAGIIIGVVVLVSLVILIIFLIRRKKLIQSKKDANNNLSMEMILETDKSQK